MHGWSWGHSATPPAGDFSWGLGGVCVCLPAIWKRQSQAVWPKRHSLTPSTSSIPHPHTLALNYSQMSVENSLWATGGPAGNWNRLAQLVLQWGLSSQSKGEGWTTIYNS